MSVIRRNYTVHCTERFPLFQARSRWYSECGASNRVNQREQLASRLPEYPFSDALQIIIDKRPKPLTTPVAPWHSSDPSHPPPSHPPSWRGDILNCTTGREDIKRGLFAYGRQCSHFICLKRVISRRTTGRPVSVAPALWGWDGRGGRAPSCTTGVTAMAGWPPTSPLSGSIVPLPSFKSVPHPPPSPSVSSASDPASLTPPHHQLSSALQRLQIATYLYDGGVDYTGQCPIGEAGSILEDRLRPLRHSSVARLMQKSLEKEKKEKKQPSLHLVPLCSHASSPSNELHEAAL